MPLTATTTATFPAVVGHPTSCILDKTLFSVHVLLSCRGPGDEWSTNPLSHYFDLRLRSSELVYFVAWKLGWNV